MCSTKFWRAPRHSVTHRLIRLQRVNILALLYNKFRIFWDIFRQQNCIYVWIFCWGYAVKPKQIGETQFRWSCIKVYFWMHFCCARNCFCACGSAAKQQNVHINTLWYNSNIKHSEITRNNERDLDKKIEMSKKFAAHCNSSSILSSIKSALFIEFCNTNLSAISKTVSKYQDRNMTVEYVRICLERCSAASWTRWRWYKDRL